MKQTWKIVGASVGDDGFFRLEVERDEKPGIQGIEHDSTPTPAPIAPQIIEDVLVTESGEVFVVGEPREDIAVSPMIPRERIVTVSAWVDPFDGALTLYKAVCASCKGRGVSALTPEGFDGPPCEVCEGSGELVDEPVSVEPGKPAFTLCKQGNPAPFPVELDTADTPENKGDQQAPAAFYVCFNCGRTTEGPDLCSTWDAEPHQGGWRYVCPTCQVMLGDLGEDDDPPMPTGNPWSDDDEDI